MYKKIFYIFTLVLLITSFSITSFAEDLEDQKLLNKYTILADKNTSDTEQFLVTITRPEGDESTFKKSYVICGNTVKDDIRVMLLIYDKDEKKYIPFANTDGDYMWDIGASGIFMKEVILPNKGANDVRIIAFKKNETEKLVPKTNLQINSFTVSVLDNGIKEAIKTGFLKITDMLNGLFK
ncbi:hypothetical protein [Acetivibrio clariflavus]|uniref:Uncharacterized protein n=1 Tax=Acetivibrio clariflavus (strain DSM 19732 / NBRC 101661 / EBR45) TaxID=720554 RepID=G8LUF5_ACECE|nr:hypothetical protein [Acetivibrio clariflavus]AEV70603.1 hypothetical protein Clocl_4173 [Acetivibrio clariflavus DSM 19732]